jgi:3-oxoacyl-[acyl-carrier protein] reductase
MLLKDKVAVIYGAGGSVGSTTARAFAREGAKVFLAGRTLAKLETLAQEISNAGGVAEAAQVDALDKDTIENHLNALMSKSGRLDISFNVIGLDAPQGTPFVNMNPAHFAPPIGNAMLTHFLTATAAVRHMAKHKSGVILALTAQAGRKPYPESGAFGVACAAIEGFCRQLALEAGPSGVRVVCLRSSGSPDTPGVREAMKLHAKTAGVSLEEWEAKISEVTMLKRMPRLAEVANVAVLMASDYASPVTGAVTNVTCGELAD